jgi:Secretion system C-terminal sorting domain
MDATDPMAPPTLYLTNRQIGPSDLPVDPHGVGGAWIEVRFTDLTIRDYALGEFWAIMACWIVCPYYGNCAGYLGTAGLTAVDQVGGRAYGWIDFRSTVLGYTISAKGSFDVPCALPPTGLLEQSPPGLPPDGFDLEQNYPNPFNPSTTIKYELPKVSDVRLSVYDMLGREVSVLVNERKNAGSYEVKLDAAGLGSGVYLCRLQAGDFVQSRKLLLLR